MRSPAALALALGLGLPTLAAAAPQTSRHVPRHRVGASFGYDPTWTLGVGYEHGLRGVLRGHDLSVGGRYVAPLPTWVGGRSWRLTAGAAAQVHLPATLGVGLGIDSGVVHGRDVTGRRTGWSLELVARPGTYRDRWSAGLDLRWRSVPVASFRHSSVVADTFDDRYPEGVPEERYAGPRDGAVVFPAQKGLLGAFVGTSLVRQHLGLFLLGGLVLRPQRQGVLAHAALGQMPFYVQLGVDGRW